MRTCLVTGGAGFIGSHVAQALCARGARVRVLDNLSTGKLENLRQLDKRIEFVEGDVADSSTVAAAVAGVDCVFHQAALASVPRSVEQPMDTHAACVTGTLNVLDQARRAGVRRLIYAASSSAYGNQPNSPKRETDRPMPVSPYGAAKLAGEAYCQAFAAAYGFETVSLRYFNVFGPRQDPNSQYSAVIPRFITALLAGRQPTIFGDGQQSRDFTYVDDTSLGIVRAAECDALVGDVVNVAYGSEVSVADIAKALASLIGREDLVGVFEASRPGDVDRHFADISKARRLWDFEPKTSLTEGLEKTLGWFRSEGIAESVNSDAASQPNW